MQNLTLVTNINLTDKQPLHKAEHRTLEAGISQLFLHVPYLAAIICFQRPSELPPNLHSLSPALVV